MEKKVLIDLSSYRLKHEGGKDEATYNLIRAFQENGHGKDVICYCHKDLVPIINPLIPDAQIITVRFAPKSKAVKILQFLMLNYQLINIIRRNRVGIVFFTNKRTMISRLRVKSIMLPHDVAILNRSNPQYSPSLRNNLTRHYIFKDFRLRDIIIAISEFYRQYMEECVPWAKHKIKLIYDPVRFTEDTPEIFEEEKKYITAVNIQHLHKNCITLIRAFCKIASSTELNLMLVGKTPANYEELKAFVAENHLENRVTFTGYVPWEELEEIICHTRVYVNPSLWEGFGMPPVEMMGRGIPTIVAGNTAMPETTLGLCSCYTPADDADRLAMAITDELAHPKSKDELLEIARAVRDKYDYRKIGEDYWNLFEEIMKESDGVS